MIFILFYTLACAYLLLGVFFSIGILKLPLSKPVQKDLPNVSVLVSCRNESKDLPGCIDSLIALDYPNNKLQIIFIDDFSTDSTPEILTEAASQNLNVEFYSSKYFPKTHLEAKARGISFAASKAAGEWLFVTDADCRVPNSWIKNMLDGIDSKTGIITGPMETLNPTYIGSLEKIVGLGKMVFAFGIAGFNISMFALGPNMAIRKKAYENAGGLESADFKIAEDIALFKMAQNNGYKTKYHFDKSTLVKLTPVSNFKQLTSQQVRWLKGGFEGKNSHIIEFVIMVLFLLFFPLLLVLAYLFFVDLAFALQFFLLKSLSETIMMFIIKLRFKSKGLFRLLPLAFIYSLFIYTWLPIASLTKKKAKWLGDGYEVNYD